RHYKTPEELQELLDSEIKGEKAELPANNFLENSLRIAIAGEFTATELKVYGYPEVNPQYLFLVEYSKLQFPYLHVRAPLNGHKLDLLEESAPLIISKIAHLLAKHGKLLVVGDAESCDICYRHLCTVTGEKYQTSPVSPTCACGMFYMTPSQKEAVLAENFTVPEGFSLEPVDVDRDGETIHRLWKNGISAELPRNRLRYLPSLCARTTEGESQDG
ncbi:hypothetical protein PMAYCL1PPCAC_33396, partial [Pristionchus mayeri]